MWNNFCLIWQVSTDYKLTLLRYMELGRGLADCFLMQVGEFMRAFILVLFSDKFLIGLFIVFFHIDIATNKNTH